MNWRHVVVAQILVSMVGCGYSEQNSTARNSESKNRVAPPESVAAPPNERPRDSTTANVSVGDFPRLIAKVGRFEAYADRSSPNGAPTILVRIAGRGSAEVGTSIPLAEWEAYPVATWFTPAPSSTPLLQLSWQQTGEGSTGSSIYSFASRAARRVFSDQGDACVPARLVDIDHDGRTELLSYSNESDGCSLLCNEVLRDYGIGEPSWTEIFEWNGTTWSPLVVENAEFRDSIASTYSKLADTVRASADPLCRASRTRIEASLRQWAARSRVLADSGRRSTVKPSSIR